MNAKSEIIDSLNKQMPYCTNPYCINYFEDSCMYNVSDEGMIETTPMNQSDTFCEAFIEGRNPAYLESEE